MSLVASLCSGRMKAKGPCMLTSVRGTVTIAWSCVAPLLGDAWCHRSVMRGAIAWLCIPSLGHAWCHRSVVHPIARSCVGPSFGCASHRSVMLATDHALHLRCAAHTIRGSHHACPKTCVALPTPCVQVRTLRDVLNLGSNMFSGPVCVYNSASSATVTVFFSSDADALAFRDRFVNLINTFVLMWGVSHATQAVPTSTDV
eukprot:358326-Chlamydomonas_euryale.AAC.3